MLSTGGMLDYAQDAEREHPGGPSIVATETGMLYPMQQAAPDVTFIAANRAAVCRYMKMITLPKLRDALRDLSPEVKVPPDARRAGAHPDRAHGRDRAAQGLTAGPPAARPVRAASCRPHRLGRLEVVQTHRGGERRRSMGWGGSQPAAPFSG